MNPVRRKACIMIAVVCVALATSQSQGQAPHVAPQPTAGMGKIEFENDTMTVVSIHMAPHEKTPMHDIASPRLVVWLTDVHLKDTGADGSVSEYRRRAGSVDWITPRRHMGENLSEHDLDFIAIIPKR